MPKFALYYFRIILMFSVLCSQYATPHAESKVTEPNNRDLGHLSSAQKHSEVLKLYQGAYADHNLLDFLNALSSKLTKITPTPNLVITVVVLDSDQINAFTTPDNHLYITRGFLALTSSSDEIAAVMAHEIGHIALHHADKRERYSKMTTRLVKAFQKYSLDSDYKALQEQLEQIQIAKFSRTQEYEADQFGIDLLIKAGYNPLAALHFLEHLNSISSNYNQLLTTRKLLSSKHPTLKSRIQNLKHYLKKTYTIPLKKEDRINYLKTLINLPYGPNVCKGTIVHKTYFDPEVNLAFNFLPDLTIERRSDLIVGHNEHDTIRYLFKKFILLSDRELNPHYFFKENWSDPLKDNRIERIQHNGVVYHLGTTKDPEWYYTLALTYHTKGAILLAIASKKKHTSYRYVKEWIKQMRSIKKDELNHITQPILNVITVASKNDRDQLIQTLNSSKTQYNSFKILNSVKSFKDIRLGNTYKILTNQNLSCKYKAKCVKEQFRL